MVDWDIRMNHDEKQAPMATMRAKRAREQRDLIAKKIACPPRDKRVFGPPTPTNMYWGNAADQQRYLELVQPGSEHEQAYNKWHTGNPTERPWKELNFFERSHWVVFYLDFVKLELKEGVEISDKTTQEQDREEYATFYKPLYKRKFVPEKVEDTRKRQKVYDVDGKFIGWLNRMEPKSSRGKGTHVIKKEEAGEKEKKYGPENAIPKRGPWRPVKAFGPQSPPNNDSMIDPALRGSPSMVTSPPNILSISDLKLEVPKHVYSQFSPSPRLPPPLPLSQNPFKLPPPKVEPTYNQWPQTKLSPLVSSSTTPESATRTWPRYGTSPAQQTPNMQMSPSPRPKFVQRDKPAARPPPKVRFQPPYLGTQPTPPIQPHQHAVPSPPLVFQQPYVNTLPPPAHRPTRPRFTPQSPLSRFPPQVQSNQQPTSQDETMNVDTDKFRLDPYGYMLPAAQAARYKSPYAASGSKEDDGTEKKEYKSPYAL